MLTLDLLKSTPHDQWVTLPQVLLRREIYREDGPEALRWQVFVDSEAIDERERFRFILFSPQYDDTVGIGHYQMSGKTPWEALNPVDAAKVTYQYQQCLDFCRLQNETYPTPFVYSEYLQLGDEFRWWSTTLQPIIENGKVWKLVGSCKQIVSIEASLRTAIQESKLEVHYQPICRLSSECAVCYEDNKCTPLEHCIEGYEALIRWPNSGYSPDDFLPIAKSSGVIQEVTNFVIKEAAAFAAQLPGSQWVSINIANCFFETQIEHAMKKHVLKPDKLRIEITEDCKLTPTTIARFRYARFIGVPLELDDFLCDNSTFKWLDYLEPVAIKLDKQFVTNAHADLNKATICRGIVSVAQNRNPPIDVIVEGIESIEDLLFFAEMGARYGQGWLLGKPAPITKIT